MKTLVYFLVALARQQWLPILGNLLASFFSKKSSLHTGSSWAFVA